MSLRITVEEFARKTPDVPAERIECSGCGETYIGDPANGDVCPRCEVDA